MTWFDIHQQLSSEVDKTSKVLEALPESNHPQQYLERLKELRRAEIQQGDAIDKACWQYATTRLWPKLSPTQALLAHIRLGHAAQFAYFLATHQSQIFPTHYQDSQMGTILEFLLVDYWKFAGNSRWRTT